VCRSKCERRVIYTSTPIIFATWRHILVTTPTHVDDNIFARSQLLRKLNSKVNCVARLKCRNDTLVLAHQFKSLQSFIIRHRDICGTAAILKMSIFRSHSRIIQASRNSVKRLPGVSKSTASVKFSLVACTWHSYNASLPALCAFLLIL